MRPLFLFFILILSTPSWAQKIGKTYLPPQTSEMPKWFGVFYNDADLAKVNVFDLDKEAEEYEHEKEEEWARAKAKEAVKAESLTGEENEDTYLVYYKGWRRVIAQYVQGDGYIKLPEASSFDIGQSRIAPPPNEVSSPFHQNSIVSPTSTWSLLGPKNMYKGTSKVAWQAYISSCAAAPSNTDILYTAAGTGGIFKTTDKGLTWNLVLDDSPNNNVVSTGSGDAFLALSVHPTNPDIVYAGRTNLIRVSTNGGTSWSSVILSCGDVNSFAINASNPNIVYAACANGLYKTTDAGVTWAVVTGMTTICYDVYFKTNDANTIFILKEVGNFTEFWRSTDGGVSFAASITGWVNQTATAHSGGRMAVTPADPNRLYAVVLGNDKPYIYKSVDAGANWVIACTGAGAGLQGKWDPPLGMENGLGFGTLDIIANPNNADEVIVATTTAYKSTNGATSFSVLGGYLLGLNIHPDIREMIVAGNDTWIASDGGMNYSSDFFTNSSNYSVRTDGIYGTDYWGFTQGWNEDVTGGGTYHNGDNAMYEAYPSGAAINLRGGEQATGYYMMGKERRIAFSDANGGFVLPATFGGSSSSFTFNKFPSEDYGRINASELEFLPYCYGHIFIGNGNSLWKSTDDGLTWVEVYNFGSTVRQFEISRSNPDVLYVATASALYKSINAGVSWTTFARPSGGVSYSNLQLALSFSDENTLWMTGYFNASNLKVFKTTDGGATWTNLTTATINGNDYYNIVAQAGTNGGVYIFGKKGYVYYHNNTMSDWVLFNDQLPKGYLPLKSMPFYRDGKLRTAGNRGIWQADFYEESAPVAQPTVNKLTTTCTRDTFYFDDFSALKHAGATWNWSFSPTPQYVSNANARNPKVVFGAVGTYSFTLTVTNAASQSSSKTITNKITVTNEGTCDPDTIPNQAASFTGSGSNYIISSKYFPNATNDDFSISFWMKSSDAGSPRTILGTRNVSSSTSNGSQGWAFVLRAGILHFELGDGSTVKRIQTSSTINDGTWHYIAGTVNNTGNMELFVDGVSIGTQSVAALGTISNAGSTVGANANSILGFLYFGKDNHGADAAYPYTGQIDEVKIWNVPLIINDIREKRHLTAYPQEPNLAGYYQFNNTTTGTLEYDRKGANNLTINGASRIASTAPVGGGVSSVLTVTSSGIKTFTDTDCEMEFPTGTLPNGNIVVTKLNVAPDQLPTAVAPLSNKYWIVDNYGTSSFTVLTSIKFSNLTGFAGGIASNYKLFKRASNADGATWGTEIDAADILNNAALTFSTGNNITSFSQFTMAKDAVIAIDLLDFKAIVKEKQVELTWQLADEKDLKFYVIERSFDGKTFKNLTQFNKGTFSTTDETPQYGLNYYRLKIVENDGKATYSPIRSVNMNLNKNTDFTIFPNPTNDILNIKFNAESAQNVDFELISAAGQIVHKYRLEGKQGVNNLYFRTSLFPKGQYLLRIKQGDKIVTEKVTIQ